MENGRQKQAGKIHRCIHQKRYREVSEHTNHGEAGIFEGLVSRGRIQNTGEHLVTDPEMSIVLQ